MKIMCFALAAVCAVLAGCSDSRVTDAPVADSTKPAAPAPTTEAPAAPEPQIARCYNGSYKVVGDNAAELSVFAQRLPKALAYFRETDEAVKAGHEFVLERIRNGGDADVRPQMNKFEALQQRGEKLFPRWTPYFRCGQLGFAAAEYFRAYLGVSNGLDRREFESAHRLWNDTATNCDAEIDYGPPEPALKILAPGGSGNAPFPGCTYSPDATTSAPEPQETLKEWTCPTYSLPGCPAYLLSAEEAKLKARWLYERISGTPHTAAFRIERIDLALYNRYIEGQLKRAIKIAPVEEPAFKPYLVCVEAAKSLYQFATIRRAENGQSAKSEKYRQPYWQQIGQCKEVVGS